MIISINERYRVINIYLKDRVLKGYAQKDSASQDLHWKDVTRRVYDAQKLLSENGFPCYDVGRVLTLNGLLLYEEFSKDKEQADKEDVSIKNIKNFILKSLHCIELTQSPSKFGGLYTDILTPLFIDCEKYFSKQNGNIYLNDILYVDCLSTYDEFASSVLMYCPNGLKYKILKSIDEILRFKRWKSLFLVENVKRKVVRLFRKDISLDQKDLLMNVLTTKSGDSKEKQKEKH